jgi:hypothetical protein
MVINDYAAKRQDEKLADSLFQSLSVLIESITSCTGKRPGIDRTLSLRTGK